MLSLAPELRALVKKGVPMEHLKIGECIFCREHVLINTVLGSCVSATFFHPQSQTSAIFHAMLPNVKFANDKQGTCNFVNSAIDSIVTRFQKAYIPLGQLEIKVFGGANTMRGPRRAALREMLDVGKKNVDQAFASLQKRGLSPLTTDVLGDTGRKLIFYTKTGEVWLKMVDAETIHDFVNMV